MINILTRTGNLNAARNFILSTPKLSSGAVALHDRFFNSLIRAYGRSGLVNESIKLFKSMKDHGVSPSIYSFNSIISVLLSRGRTNMAKDLFYELCDSPSVSPDVCTFNTLIRGFCLNSMVDDGFWFFKEMSRFSCSPDIITYNTLVDGLCRAGKVKIAHNLLKGMFNKHPHLKPNIVTYTTLIRGYCEKLLVSNALDLFEEMVACGLKPNEITYNTLIMGLCEVRMLDKIKEILPSSREFRPDTCTFNTLINSHCNTGNLDEAMNIFEKMSDLEVEPDAATFSLLIRSLCKIGNFEKAELLFDELEKKQILLRNEGSVPLVAAYNPMFDYLCKEGKTQKAEKVFRQLMKRGTQDPTAFKTLIKGHCREGTFQDGFEILVLMLRREFVPDIQVYSSLIDGFLHKEDPTFAYKTLEKMLKSNHTPKTTLFYSILDGLVKHSCARDAASLLTLMLEKKVRQNINLSTETVILLFKTGLKDDSFEIVKLIYSNGYSLKMEKVIEFLCEKRRFSEAREILLFIMANDQEVDLQLSSMIITGLCQTMRAPEAFSLFYELTERGLQPALSCLKDLKYALESDKKQKFHKEAEFVSNQMLRRT
ncbi:pentatricopeptide repeat-containing protein At1g02060, chloroplastic [Aristolochia californica]|uniref:pentatricopeptide repeat-containing protein At1g02060, chloroplastic n=1 Tax=Aristolochia californica TaxID=171875 RepID=UPI0035E24E9D